MSLVPSSPLSAGIVMFSAPQGPWSGLVDALSRAGARVLVSEEFEGRCVANRDLAMVDVELLRAAGRDFASVVRDLALSGDTPVIALTRRGAHADVAAALEAGAIGFVDDSDEPETAVLRVSFALRARTERRTRIAAGGDDANAASGMPTRAQFASSIASSIERARVEHRSMAVLCFDAGRFRQLVASLAAADAAELIDAVAQRMRDVVRESDLLARNQCRLEDRDIARIGGEEFSLLLEGLVCPEDAARIGHRLVDALARPFVISGRELCLSMTVGIARYPTDGNTPEELLQAAGLAALCSKQTDPDAVQFFSPLMIARAFERHALESELRLAIERNELFLHYQPRIEIATGRTVAVEALVRWQHPRLGLVPPAQFIPLAEETGLIVRLGDYVLEHACAQNREWRGRGFAPVRIAVNVSPVQFHHPELFASVMSTLARSGLDPTGLELEITESALMQGFGAASHTLQRFKQVGIEVSIDDFGTGWSSLSYLRKFAVDALKIDQSFLREVTSNREDAAIVTAIVLMGKSLGLRVVAEGVETPGQLAFLRIMQCDEAQGYLFGQPLPALEVERFLGQPLVLAA